MKLYHHMITMLRSGTSALSHLDSLFTRHRNMERIRPARIFLAAHAVIHRSERIQGIYDADL